ncbi:MAG: LacI family DNA-binding transcriptional regulator [bacterium]
MEFKRVTIRDIAGEAGVSPSTVSRALNDSGYVGERTRKRIMEVVRRTNYHPDISARSLRTRRTHIIALGVTDISNPYSNPYTAELARGVQDFAERRDYIVALFNTDGVLEKERKLIRTVLRSRFDGLIFFPHEVGAGDMRPLKDSDIPFVLFDARPDVPEGDVVVTDDRKGGYTATKHLISLGHSRIGFVGFQVNALDARLQGYKDALSESGLPVEEGLIFVAGRTIAKRSGQEAIRYLLGLKSPPTAIFAVNDIVAIEAMVEAKKMGLKIPEDLAIVGFDNIYEASITTPRLSTIAHPTYNMGSLATQILLQRIEGGGPPQRQKVVIEPDLVVRESTVLADDSRSEHHRTTASESISGGCQWGQES